MKSQRSDACDRGLVSEEDDVARAEASRLRARAVIDERRFVEAVEPAAEVRRLLPENGGAWGNYAVALKHAGPRRLFHPSAFARSSFGTCRAGFPWLRRRVDEADAARRRAQALDPDLFGPA